MSEEVNKSAKQKPSKVDRKVHRAVKKISKDVGPIFSKEPTNALIICNSGHVTGATYESLAELFSPYGNLEEIVLVPGKSFCFIKYLKVENSLNAFEGCHGIQTLSESKLAIYLSFVTNIPPQYKKDTTPKKPPIGLKIVEKFITTEEETELLKSFNWNDEVKLKNRQVRHYGKEFIYGSNTIATDDQNLQNMDPFPDAWTPFLQRSLDQGYQKRFPDQCTVNRYLPGHGIPPHVDNHNCCDDTILSLSLGSDVIMNFVDLDDPDHPTIPINLPARSLMIMTDQARYTYTHGIVPRKSDIITLEEAGTLTLRNRGERVSLTFRKSLSESKCGCNFPTHCPAQKKLVSSSMDQMDNATAIQLEKMHVHSVYEEIADHFSETRHKPWPKVMDFLNSKLTHPGAILVDVGCGNGKYLGHLKNAYQLGLDYSRNLLTFVQNKNLEAVRSDVMSIPLRDGVADACISIAVIHHLSTKERRIQAVREIFRVLKPSGSALLYAWAKDQEINCQPSTYLSSKTETDQQMPATNTVMSTTKTECKIALPVHANRTNFKHNDLLVPWKRQTDSNSFHRFYHVFEKGELEMLLQEALGPELIHIQDLYYDQGNWCACFVKK